MTKKEVIVRFLINYVITNDGKILDFLYCLLCIIESQDVYNVTRKC